MIYFRLPFLFFCIFSLLFIPLYPLFYRNISSDILFLMVSCPYHFCYNSLLTVIKLCLAKVTHRDIIRNSPRLTPTDCHLPTSPQGRMWHKCRFYVGRIRVRGFGQKFSVDPAYTWSGLSTSPDENLPVGILSSGFFSVV